MADPTVEDWGSAAGQGVPAAGFLLDYLAGPTGHPQRAQDAPDATGSQKATDQLTPPSREPSWNSALMSPDKKPRMG